MPGNGHYASHVICTTEQTCSFLFNSPEEQTQHGEVRLLAQDNTLRIFSYHLADPKVWVLAPLTTHTHPFLSRSQFFDFDRTESRV